MEQLHIRHCKLRLCRNSGWSWGADPKRLIRMATQALPGLIANKLGQLLVDQKQSLTISRLTLNIPVKMSELKELRYEPDKDMANTLLADRISQQLEQALAVQAGVAPSQSVEPTNVEPTKKNSRNLPALALNNDGISLLQEWYQQGKLIQLLQYFSTQASSDWEKLALKSLPESVVEVENYQHLLTEAEQFCPSVLQSLNKQTALGVQRLVLLVALLQKYPNLFAKEIIKGLLDKYVSVDTDSPKVPIQQRTLSMPFVKKRSSQSFEVNVSSVLPFVCLGILSRFGYFDVLATAINAAEVDMDIHYFAVALAYKMLPAPHRGWHRDQADMHTAAAVAGLQEGISGEVLDHFALCCQPCLSPTDGYLQQLLTEGHDPSHALLIHQVTLEEQPLWVLLDSQGCFPIAWFTNQQSLLQALEEFSGNTFLISKTAAHNTFFAELSIRHHRFVTMLPPGRQDQWRPIDRRRLFWTNDLEAQTRWLLKQSQCFPDVIAAADEITQALIVDRPVLHKQVQKAYALQFEQSVALAASSALGTIAWQLWGENEVTDPVLTIDRLSNLGGKIVFDKEKITVRPSLGKRYQDLYDHNFLVDVNNISWFGGRRMEFAGG